MAELKMLAIDLGASSGRGIVGSFDGEKLTLRENHRFSNDPMYVNGRFTWDILRIYFEIKNSITKTIIDGDDIASMGIDTWGVDYGMIDKNGRLMANPIHYRDARTENVTDYVKNFVSPEEIYNVTGIQAIDFNTLNQLAVEKRDNGEAFDRADKLLFIPDLLNYFLTTCCFSIMMLPAQRSSLKKARASCLSSRMSRTASITSSAVSGCV